jgi:hypothetical protein
MLTVEHKLGLDAGIIPVLIKKKKEFASDEEAGRIAERNRFVSC